MRIQKRRKNALKALALDDQSAEAHSSLATIHLWYDWNGVDTENELRRAIELNPNYSRAYHYLGRLRATDWGRPPDPRRVSEPFQDDVTAASNYRSRRKVSSREVVRRLRVRTGDWPNGARR